MPVQKIIGEKEKYNNEQKQKEQRGVKDMSTTLNLTPEKVQERINQADEMAIIWEQSPAEVQMYLKGCIVTAKALSERRKEPQEA